METFGEVRKALQKRYVSLPLLYFSQLWESKNLRTGHQQFRLGITWMLPKQDCWGNPETPNVGSYWHGPFPQTTGNSYLPSWPSSPPDTSPSCGTISLYCRAIPVWYCMPPTAVGEAQPGGSDEILWRKLGRNKLVPKEQGRDNVKYKFSFSSAEKSRQHFEKGMDRDE